jgi:hypothetical protein
MISAIAQAPRVAFWHQFASFTVGANAEVKEGPVVKENRLFDQHQSSAAYSRTRCPGMRPEGEPLVIAIFTR